MTAPIHLSRLVLFAIGIAATGGGAIAAPEREIESLDRGVVAVADEDRGVFVGWRLLGCDPTEIAFNVYRPSDDQTFSKRNAVPISDATHFIDAPPPADKEFRYSIRAVVDGAERPLSKPVPIWSQGHLDIPIDPIDGYRPGVYKKGSFRVSVSVSNNVGASEGDML